MILFFSGAPKHASHFQFNIIREALVQQGIDFEHVGQKIFNAHDYKSIKELLDTIDSSNDKLYLVKGHLGYAFERDFLLSYKSMRVFLIWRDLRDVLVSQFYYLVNKGQKNYNNFSEFYWQHDSGRALFRYHLDYHKTWEQVAHDPRVFSSSFNELKNNFNKAASEMLEFCNIRNVDMNDLSNRISVDTLRKKSKEKALFRRGIVGEYKEVIKPDELVDLECIEKLYKSSLSKRCIYELKVIKNYPNKFWYLTRYLRLLRERLRVSRWNKQCRTLFNLG